MRTLILMRHAKAVRPDEADTDRARGLTGRGRCEAAEAGAALYAHGVEPDLALASTAARTRETASIALEGRGLETRFQEALYNAGADTLWDMFMAQTAERVLIVGHNPALGELAAHFVTAAWDGSALARQIQSGFPTSAWAAFEIDGDVLEAPCARLIAAWRPERN